MRSISARCGVLVQAVVQGSKGGEARKGKLRQRKSKKQASEVRKGSAMPICWQGGGAGGRGGGAACASVTVLPVVEVPRRTRVRGNDSALHFKGVN